MWNRLMACSAVAIGAAFMVSACGTVDEEINRASGDQVDSDSAELKPDATGQFCGGFGNLPCPQGYGCIDDPNDSCDPTTTGRDCGGICVEDDGATTREREDGAANCSKKDPAKQYAVRDPETCLATTFICEAGTTPFFDECGCGCTTEDPAARQGAGAACGTATCGKGEYCCNESCSLCVPEGNFCTQQVCEGEPCGNTVCGAGEFCCNESCGICAPLGGGCTQQICNQGEPCGHNTCGAGEFCCNESCGICAPEGGGCTQQICEPSQF